MKYTREDIQKMPVKRLRLLDISEPEDEALVQALIQEKLAEQPIVGSPARARPHATDNLTPETEAVLQAQIDAANASKKAAALGPIVNEETPEVDVEEAAPLSHPADQESEIEANLAQLEAERAALEEAAEVPFVPEEVVETPEVPVEEVVEEPVVEPEVPAPAPKSKGKSKK